MDFSSIIKQTAVNATNDLMNADIMPRSKEWLRFYNFWIACGENEENAKKYATEQESEYLIALNEFNSQQGEV